MRSFDPWERLTLIALLVLLGLPALLLAEVAITRKPSPYLILVNIAFIILIARLLIRRHSTSGTTVPRFFITPLPWIFLLQLTIIIIIFSAYLALPDVDPYHWIKSYNQNFIDSSLAELPQRPLFHTFIYTLDQVPYLKAEAIFKYVIPLLSLTSLIPAWLVARKYSLKIQQVIFLLVPLSSPSLIIHTQMGTPQAILIILTIFFAFLLIYSHLTRNKFWHYLAGAIMLLAVPVHGLALLMFTAWLAASAWHHPKRHYIFLLLLPIAILVTPYLLAYLPQVLSDVRLNLTFPAAFTTIDGVPNGWPGLLGLSQYYAFYLGLAVPVILIANICLYIKQPTYRQKFSQLLSSPSILTLIVMLAGFFLIAETLPRFFNITILPDRAWLFASLAATIFLIPLFNLKFKQQKLIYNLLFLLFAINIGGALYVNNLKQHFLPDYMVTSARWINENLPPATAVLLNRKPEYIDLYAPVTFIPLPQNYFCHPSDTPPSQTGPRYVLFLKPDRQHPYANRPWQESPDNNCDQPTLNSYPENFRQIYNNADQAVIWRIL